MNLLSSLRCLVALHQHQHFGRAAAACHITQPALSNAIRALEEEYGITIVRRDRSYIGLTPEGERVLASAHAMLREAQNLQQDLQSATSSPSGALRIAAVPTAIPIAARFAARLQARHPAIQPTVLSMSSGDLELGLESLHLDLALGYSDRASVRTGKFHALPQYHEYYCLLAREQTNHRLLIAAPMRWVDAAKLPLCLLTPDMHNRTIVDAAFAHTGASVQPAMETNSITTALFAVVAGTVCSVLPVALIDTLRHQPGVQAHPLIEPNTKIPVAFLTHASARPSRALAAALAFAQDEYWLPHLAEHSSLPSFTD